MTTRGSMFSRKRITETAHTIATSLIAHGTRVTGDVSFEGSLYLEGQIDGQVMATKPGALLTVGGQGLVRGDIRVPAAIIHGNVCGDVYALERLELAATARIEGDVCYRSIVVVAGAQIHGLMQHDSAGGDEDASEITTEANSMILSTDHADDSSIHHLEATAVPESPPDMRSRKRGRHRTTKDHA